MIYLGDRQIALCITRPLNGNQLFVFERVREGIPYASTRSLFSFPRCSGIDYVSFRILRNDRLKGVRPKNSKFRAVGSVSD